MRSKMYSSSARFTQPPKDITGYQYRYVRLRRPKDDAYIAEALAQSPLHSMVVAPAARPEHRERCILLVVQRVGPELAPTFPVIRTN